MYAVEHVVPFYVFATLVSIGSVLFGLGLIFDGLLINQTKKDADETEREVPAIASALRAGIPWRWLALVLNLTGALLTIPGRRISKSPAPT